jgi:L-iditol 2-dehydrogenase
MNEFPRAVQAAVIESPGELRVRAVPLAPLGEYDALCALLYGATCSGTDQHLLAGYFPWTVRYPTVLGHESIGRVVWVGARVRNLRVGDLVTRVGLPAPDDGSVHINWGGFAAYGVARDHWAMREDGLERAMWYPYRVNQVLPPDIDPAEATMVITWRETLSYLSRIGICPGADLLVIGSGGNGLAFAAHAAHMGARRIVVVGSAARRETALAVGATEYVDYRSEAVDAGGGFDVIVDAVGKADTADAMLPLLDPGGTLGVYGIDDYDRCQIHPHRARGTFTLYGGGYDEAETHERVVALMQAGRLQARHWLDLDRPFSLAEIDRAIEAVRLRKAIKALVRLSGG